MSTPIDLAVETFLRKAENSLDGAASEFANGRVDNCANRAYYACFQAAIAALVHEGIGTSSQAEHWGHDYVQARFIGELVNRRKRFPAVLGETLIKGLALRQTADYRLQRVSEVRASRGLARSEEFVVSVRSSVGRHS